MAAPALVCEPGSISIKQAEDIIYAPGAPCELVDVVCEGRPQTLFKNALPNVRVHWEQTIASFGERPYMTMYTPEGNPEVRRAGFTGLRRTGLIFPWFLQPSSLVTTRFAPSVRRMEQNDLRKLPQPACGSHGLGSAQNGRQEGRPGRGRYEKVGRPT